jgi:hypothetical protein
MGSRVGNRPMKSARLFTRRTLAPAGEPARRRPIAPRGRGGAIGRYRDACDAGKERSAEALERRLDDLRHTAEPAA